MTTQNTIARRFTAIDRSGVLNTVLSENMARHIAKQLRADGYAVSIAICRKNTPQKIAEMIGTPNLARKIATLAGLIPGEPG